MVIEEAMVAHLKANAGFAGVFAGRLYPNRAPQKPTYPLAVYFRVSGARAHVNDGPAGCASPRFQFMVVASTYPEVKAGVEKIRLALDGFSGTMGGAGGVDVFAVFLEDDADDYDDELLVHWARMDFIVWHFE